MEKIEEKLKKEKENRILNIEIQQNTNGKVVEQIIFKKYQEITIKNDDIEKGSLDEKLLGQYLELERKRKIKEGKQIVEKEATGK